MQVNAYIVRIARDLILTVGLVYDTPSASIPAEDTVRTQNSSPRYSSDCDIRHSRTSNRLLPSNLSRTLVYLHRKISSPRQYLQIIRTSSFEPPLNQKSYTSQLNSNSSPRPIPQLYPTIRSNCLPISIQQTHSYISPSKFS